MTYAQTLMRFIALFIQAENRHPNERELNAIKAWARKETGK